MNRWQRIRRMPAREWAGRARQLGRRWVDRVAPAYDTGGGPRRRRSIAEAGVDEAAQLRHFVTMVPHRFFAGPQDLEALSAASFPSSHVRTIVEDADRALAGRFHLLGYAALDYGDPIEWHTDPVSGRRAPLCHWSRIDPLRADVIGDSKVIWEVNRHQWLMTLAQAARVTSDPRYAHAVFEQVDAWSRANPYPLGINWASSLEVSLRMIAWCWALQLLRDTPALTVERFALWRKLACAHAGHVERFLSLYYSPNTHLTGEALGLVYAGVVLADHPDAARWRDRGCHVLLAELDRQIDADGAHFERATCYQRYTVEMYLHLLVLGARNGLRLPARLGERTQAMVRFLRALVGPDGHMPDMGDADGGWLLPLSRRAPTDCRGTFALAATLFGESEFAAAAQELQPEVLWVYGNGGVRTFRKLLQKPAPRSCARMIDAGGVVVMRSGSQPDAHALLMDVGPLGCPISSAHGHADLLSVQVTAWGEPFLIDAGTGCYTADLHQRNYFRSTHAHSTVVVDGHDQAEMAGPFSWAGRPHVDVADRRTNDDQDFIDASHGGYLRLPGGVVHRRRVLFLKTSGWMIVDDLTGEGTHDVEVRYLCSPRPVSLRDGWIRADGRAGRSLWLHVIGPGIIGPQIREGEHGPLDGWMSPGYGVIAAAPMLIWAARVTLPCRVTSVIVPVAGVLDTPPDLRFSLAADSSVDGVRWPDGRVVKIDDESVTVDEPDACERIA